MKHIVPALLGVLLAIVSFTSRSHAVFLDYALIALSLMWLLSASVYVGVKSFTFRGRLIDPPCALCHR